MVEEFPLKKKERKRKIFSVILSRPPGFVVLFYRVGRKNLNTKDFPRNVGSKHPLFTRTEITDQGNVCPCGGNMT